MVHYSVMRLTEVGLQFQYESNTMSGCDDKEHKRPAFGGRSLAHDGMLIRSESHLRVPIWKQYNKWLWR